LSLCLQREGYVVSEVDDTSAIALYAIEPVDLIVVHALVDPVAAVKQLRAHPSCREVPILVSMSPDRDVVAILSAGADDVVADPAGAEVTAARVRGQLARSRLSTEMKEGRARGDLEAVSSNEVVWDWNPSNGQLHMCERWSGLVGAALSSEPGRLGDWLDRVHPADLLALRDAISEQCQNPRTLFPQRAPAAALERHVAMGARAWDHGP